jgi:hypothetical protein
MENIIATNNKIEFFLQDSNCIFVEVNQRDKLNRLTWIWQKSELVPRPLYHYMIQIV